MAVALSDSDLDRIGDRVDAMFLKAMGERGSLPCFRHDTRLLKLEQARWKILGALAAIMAIASFIGSVVGGATFDRVANQALEAPVVPGATP